MIGVAVLSLIKSKSVSFAEETLHILTSFFPLVLSFAYCLGYKEIIGTMIACIAMIFASTEKTGKMMPVYLAFLITGYAFKNDIKVVLYSSDICGALLIISAFCFEKLKKLFTVSAVSGVMLAGALTATVLFTTDYFGIGATGNTVKEMIASYLSLGFHPNWRGVLYGTIVMVIMITFPRKFKKFNKTVAAPFAALALTLILNIFLNPADLGTSINEISDSDIIFVKMFLTSRFSDFEPSSLAIAVSCGISLFIVCFYAISSDKNAKGTDYILGGAANAVFCGAFNLPLPYVVRKEKRSILPGIAAAAIAFLIFWFGEEILLRIPLHSCAVVIIVGAWQSVKWGEIKKAFSGIVPVICFIFSVASCLILGIVNGILVSAIVSIIYSGFSKKLKDF